MIRNLLLLFFIGLFPFNASLITRAKGSIIALFLYMIIILLCIAAQFILYQYIIVKRPALRINTDLSDHLSELHKRKVALIGFFVTAIFVAVSYLLIPDPEMKPMATLWMAGFPIAYKIFTKKKLGKSSKPTAVKN